jgi:hypothetical protein
MADVPPGILKKNQVRLAGTCRTELPAAPSAGAAGREISIAEKHDDCAVIQVRCQCGRCHYIRFRWQCPTPPAPDKNP